MKHWLTIALFALLPAAAGAATVDGVAAVVDKRVITRSEVEALAALGGRLSQGQNPSGDPRARALENLIEKALVEREAERMGVSVTDEDVARAVEDVRRRHNLDPEAFRKAIEAQGLTYPAYLEEVTSQVRRAKVAGRAMRSRMRVGDEALREHYLKNVAEYREAAAVRLQHLQLPAAAGRDAADRAREQFSREGAAGGDDMGFVAVENLSAEIRAAVEGVPVGGVTPVVLLRDAFHVFRVVERRPGRIPAFEEVRDRIRDSYFEDQEEELYQAWIDSLK
ncbi:MAG: peptidyl-prolyl cis-trans isomerase, partial [Deferrisomatales bacterium]